jgi:hypothetical protein
MVFSFETIEGKLYRMKFTDEYNRARDIDETFYWSCLIIFAENCICKYELNLFYAVGLLPRMIGTELLIRIHSYLEI